MEHMDYEDILHHLPGGDTPEQERHAVRREELTDIISSMSRMFFSTYYINLEQDTYRPIVQLRRVGNVLGDEVNYTAALQIYAQHFIHPDDCGEYLRVMALDNLRQELRWWQPNTAVEYRRMDDSSAAWSWVRATAVLARAGADDLPLTAVYVAQDIGTGRRCPISTSGGQ